MKARLEVREVSGHYVYVCPRCAHVSKVIHPEDYKPGIWYCERGDWCNPTTVNPRTNYYDAGQF